MVCSYHLESHELIDVWSVGAAVTALDSLALDDGGVFVIAVGTEEG